MRKGQSSAQVVVVGEGQSGVVQFLSPQQLFPVFLRQQAFHGDGSVAVDAEVRPRLVFGFAEVAGYGRHDAKGLPFLLRPVALLEDVLLYLLLRQVLVNLEGPALHRMPHQLLDHHLVPARFQQVGDPAVPEQVAVHSFLQSRFFRQAL